MESGTVSSKPIEDTVPKLDGTIAVGEDLIFQRKWWRFERFIWSFFAILLLCDLLGLFGRGYLAKAQRAAADGSLSLDFERVERAGTPSIMTLELGPSAIHGGRIQLFVSESVIKTLGAERISPQPSVSMLTAGGIAYTFPADGPSTVQIVLSPSFPGEHRFKMEVAGSPPIEGEVLVLP